MKWSKLGIVYKPDGSQQWAQSHAMIPTPVLLSPDCLRVYCSMCDASGIARPGYVDLNPQNPLEVIGVSSQPLLEIGQPGTFDENGVIVCSVSKRGNEYYMYYGGFELGTKIRYRILTGLAISRDGSSFTRAQLSPVLERSDAELYIRGGPFGLWDEDRMKLWYVAGSEWTLINGKSMPVYILKYQESKDGVHWQGEGKTSLALADPDEHAFGRPWVIKRGEKDYQLFFSVRKRSLQAYRLGYAESTNGIDWTRKEMNLDVTPGSFDSDAIMYSAVITLSGRTYCFYNGNDFGREGFALAELV